jgi:ubiquinone/menaquinone biosynthesis C-methylase UbiE
MTTNPALTPHAQRMQHLYRWEAAIFDCSRVPVLLGRNRLRDLVPTGARVLEVGCGTGRNLGLLHGAAGDQGEVVGMECAPAMFTRARRRSRQGIRVLLADYLDSPLPPEALVPDVVVFAYSLSMIPSFEDALHRAWESLRPGGRIVVLDFLDTGLGLVRWRMGRYAVELGGARRAWLRQRGTVLLDREFRAWGGLWHYYLTAVQKTAS